MSLEIYQPTPEQQQRWTKGDELEKYASAGIMSESEQSSRVEALLDQNYYHCHLEKIQQRKQKLLKDLAYLEQREQLLLAQIHQLPQPLSTNHSNSEH